MLSQQIIETIIQKENRMGQAHNAPKTGHRRKYHVSEHAFARLRERGTRTLAHMNDGDLCNLIDERIRFSEHKPFTVRDPRAPTAITTLQVITLDADAGNVLLYVVVRDNTVVTILDEEQAKNNYAGSWEPVLNAPFATLLQGMHIQTPKKVSALDQAVQRGDIPPPATKGEVANTKLETIASARLPTTNLVSGPIEVTHDDLAVQTATLYANAICDVRQAKRVRTEAVLVIERAQQALEVAKEELRRAEERATSLRGELDRLANEEP